MFLQSFLATFFHGGGYSLHLFETDENKKFRVIAYWAIVYFQANLAKFDISKRISDLAEMIPTQRFTLSTADDLREYPQSVDVLPLLREWSKAPSNVDAIRNAAAWLINHRVDPVEQRGAITLQSQLAKVIMEQALKGKSIAEIVSTLQRLK